MIRSEIAHTVEDSSFQILIAVATEIKELVERQYRIKRYNYLADDFERAIAWITAGQIYQDLIDRSVLIEQEEDERYSWASDELTWAICCFNNLSTDIPIELVIEQDGDEEVYVVLESEDR
jgi:hypothetical protein